MLSRKIILPAILVIVIVSVIGWITYRVLVRSEQPSNIAATTHGLCLADDEYADYPLDERYAKEAQIPKIPVVISVRDKRTNQVKFSFQIDNIYENYYLEMYRCGVYTIVGFNFDPKKTDQSPGFRAELWKYGYDGKGSKILLIAETNQSGTTVNYYSYGFRIDPSESYLVLERILTDIFDRALVIKDLKITKDTFILTLKEVLSQHPNITSGIFGLGIWTPDSKYLWAGIADGPHESILFRINTKTWKADALPTPSDMPSGVERDLNLKGWLAYADITSFTGLQETVNQIQDEARKSGIMKNLWVYNLLTKEKIKIVSVDPSWQLKPKWISDIQLQYILPSGEKKIYTIGQ